MDVEFSYLDVWHLLCREGLQSTRMLNTYQKIQKWCKPRQDGNKPLTFSGAPVLGTGKESGTPKFGQDGYIGRALARGARTGDFFFFTIPHPCLFLPPPHQTIWSTFLPCLRIWPILCTHDLTMARVVVGSGGTDILCC